MPLAREVIRARSSAPPVIGPVRRAVNAVAVRRRGRTGMVGGVSVAVAGSDPAGANGGASKRRWSVGRRWNLDGQ
jgi:hypothetical protein